MKPGIYNIYKPAGPTSHDIVNQVRRISGDPTSPRQNGATKGKEKVGHAGTLDPFAEGVLIVAVGREYTKKLGRFLKMDKTYRAIIKLGASSDTYDRTGKIKVQGRTFLKNQDPTFKKPTRKEITKVLKKFKGEIEQVPPPFSAVKIKGRKAYELARKGIAVKLKPRRIKIYSIKILKYKWPLLEIETKVSSGTYIRSLANDIGRELKTGGYLEKLVRTKVGKYDLTKSLHLDSLANRHFQKR